MLRPNPNIHPVIAIQTGREVALAGRNKLMTNERFVLARATDLQPDLSLPEGKNPKARKAALKCVLANMTVNNHEMLTLFPEILRCIRSPDVEIKRMCCLYFETYAKARPQQATEAMKQLSLEASNKSSPAVVRALALRTLSSIPSKAYLQATAALIPDAMRSEDPYLRKTACMAIAKIWSLDQGEVEANNLLGYLNRSLVSESSPQVVGVAVQSLLDITEHSQDMQFVVDYPTSLRLVSMLVECPEFSQVSILSALGSFVPQTAQEAQRLAEAVMPALHHANSAVALGASRLLLMLSHYNAKLAEIVPLQVFGPLLSQLSRPPEIQYVILRNIYLLLQTIDSEVLQKVRIAPQSFFCRASDLSYIKTTKIDTLAILSTESNYKLVLKELYEFARLKTDDAARQRALAAIGRIGIKLRIAALDCVHMLQRLLNEPKAIVSLTQLVRRYPNEAELVDEVLRDLWDLEIPVDVEGRCAYLWLIGRFPTRAASTVARLKAILDRFESEPLEVRLLLLTACARVFLAMPQEARVIVPRVFEIATEKSSNPDLRDRAFIYWRLLSKNPGQAQSIITESAPAIAGEESQFDYNELEQLELSLGYLSSIYVKPSDQVFRMGNSRLLSSSPALLPRKLDKPLQLGPKPPRSRPLEPMMTSNSLPKQQPSRPVANDRQRNGTLSEQFENLNIHSSSQSVEEDQNERLIDI